MVDQMIIYGQNKAISALRLSLTWWSSMVI